MTVDFKAVKKIMPDKSHPIQIPMEIVNDWTSLYKNQSKPIEQVIRRVAVKAAQWGSDQELDKCIEFFGDQYTWDQLSACTYWKQFRDESAELLLEARRPVPLTLKEKALNALEVMPTPSGQVTLDITDINTIRLALEEE